MAWRRIGDKPLSQPMMPHFFDTNHRTVSFHTTTSLSEGQTLFFIEHVLIDDNDEKNMIEPQRLQSRLESSSINHNSFPVTNHNFIPKSVVINVPWKGPIKFCIIFSLWYTYKIIIYPFIATVTTHFFISAIQKYGDKIDKSRRLCWRLVYDSDEHLPPIYYW